MRSKPLGLGVLVLVTTYLSGGLAAFAQTDPAQKDTAPIYLGQEMSLDILYSGRVFGIPVMRAKVSAAFVGESYAARAHFKSSGLMALFKSISVVASASGQIKQSTLITQDYWHKELDGRKNRQLSMARDPEKVTVRADPPLRSMGDPIASMEQRLEALDPVSAILALALRGGAAGRADQCAGSIKVFDGKQRYNLRLEAMGLEHIRTRAYQGQALRCNAWYVPVAGFDPDDLAEALAHPHPVTIWLADEAQSGLRVPVRFEARLDFGTARVDARKIEIKVKTRP
ncbi:MAG: hypothetical protein COA47_10590 [Robiginitomaculum sp.]|nr:MAG: hypothetical protein COA47_10590 [Robiginitomaculum sp.]